MERTSRELVRDTLEFKNTDGRVPRQLWTLPWADLYHHDALQKILDDFTWDFAGPQTVYEKRPKTEGDPYTTGLYIDEWGSRFTNIQPGVFGEVKDPLVQDDDWEDAYKIHIPEEFLSFDMEKVNADCAASDKFMMADCCPRPFEQLQFLRGTANLYMDLMDPPKKMLEFMEKMHDYYCRLLTKWAQTDVDGLGIMDDWGSQKSLLISPKLWDTYFKPMYRDYFDIAHKYGKKMFMHSDGYTLEIIPRLIDLGLDAFNTQIFCMGMDKLQQFKGKITFWGEIDRQHLIPHGSTEDIRKAVHSVYDSLWQDGGCIAQCEFGAGANPDNVYEIYKTWAKIR